MIDIHCHLLPGIDDGAKNETQAIEMATEAVDIGIKTVIATPHHKNRTYKNEKSFIVERVKKLNKLFAELYIPLNVLAGQEVRTYGELIEDYQKGKIQTLNDSKYLLLELPSDHVPAYFKQLLFNIQQAGIIPVIAHPERNRELHRDPNKLYELVKQGALAQLTAGSLTGMFGKEIKQVSHQMLEHNLIHFIASDAHNLVPRSFTTLKESYDIIKKEHDLIMQETLKENAEHLINNEDINQVEPIKIEKKRGFFGFF